MAPEVKQRYQQMAEEGRQKYDQDMAAYRQVNISYKHNTNQIVHGKCRVTSIDRAIMQIRGVR